MTEQELLETLRRARQALALASWGVARALTPSELAAATPVERTGEEESLVGALQRFRQARHAWSKARGRWQHRASLVDPGTGPEAQQALGPGTLDTLAAAIERCTEEISLGNLERLAPGEAL
jgi:hypothetical protein